MDWWHWQRAEQALSTWVRALIGDRPYTLRFDTGTGSFVHFSTRTLVVDPTLPDTLGGSRLLPGRWRGQMLTTLAALQWRCARALARHEAAHILYTQPPPGDTGGLHHWLINALEDGRIERYLGARAPWCWADLRELGRLVWQQYALPHAAAERLLSACLLHRWDVLRPRRTASRVRFSGPDARVWETQIRPLVEQAWDATDTATVAELARAILRHVGLRPDLPCPPDLVNPIGAEVRGARTPDDPPLTDGVPLRDPPPAPAPESDRTDRGEPPGIDLDLTAGQLFMQPYRPLEEEICGTIQRVTRALLPPTPHQALRPHATRGTFDPRAHLRSQGERPLLLARTRAPAAAGLAVVLLIDRTSSMGNGDFDATGQPGPGFFHPAGRMYHARRAALLLDRACVGAGIPLCIGYAGNLIWRGHAPPDPTTLHRLPQAVVWIRDWHTPPTAEGPRACLAGMYGDAGNAECVSESLRLAQARLAARPERTKLILYLHDGQPTDETPEAVQATVAAVRRSGMIVLGLFVGDQDELHRLAAIFGRDATVGVRDLTTLPARLGRILQRFFP